MTVSWFVTVWDSPVPANTPIVIDQPSDVRLWSAVAVTLKLPTLIFFGLEIWAVVSALAARVTVERNAPMDPKPPTPA